MNRFAASRRNPDGWRISKLVNKILERLGLHYLCKPEWECTLEEESDFHSWLRSLGRVVVSRVPVLGKIQLCHSSTWTSLFYNMVLRPRGCTFSTMENGPEPGDSAALTLCCNRLLSELVSFCWLTFHKYISEKKGRVLEIGSCEMRVKLCSTVIVIGCERHFGVWEKQEGVVKDGDRESERWWMDYRWCFLAELLLWKVNVCLGMPVGRPRPPDAPPPLLFFSAFIL